MVAKIALILVLAAPMVSATGLDEKARALGLRVGTAFLSDWGSDHDTAALVAAQFGFLAPTSELEWDGQDDWQTWVANASAWKLPFRGPRLAGGKTPANLNALDAKGLDREFLARLGSVLASGTGRLLSLDVAANTFTNTGDRVQNVFARVWGTDWPGHALQLVRTVDAKTPLFLAEDALYRLAVDLKARGVPLSGVALGSRQRLLFRLDPILIGANLKRFADLGLDVHLYDVDFGMEPGELLKGRGGASPQSLAYDALFRWVLAVPAVKLIAFAEPTDRLIRPWSSGWTPTSAALFTATGVPKDTALSFGQILSAPRPQVADLSAAANRQDSVPLKGLEGPGLPLFWSGDDVWQSIPLQGLGTGGPASHRADFYLNPPAGAKQPYSDEVSLQWSLAWAGQQSTLEWNELVFQAEVGGRAIQVGNRGSMLAVEVRGPGYSAEWSSVVGVDGDATGVSGTWSAGGKKARVSFKIPAATGWGPGTSFFLRFYVVAADAFNHQGVALYPWPPLTKENVPFRRFQIVKAGL